MQLIIFFWQICANPQSHIITQATKLVGAQNLIPSIKVLSGTTLFLSKTIPLANVSTNGMIPLHIIATDIPRNGEVQN